MNDYSETPSTPTVARVPLRNVFDQVPRRRKYHDTNVNDYRRRNNYFPLRNEFHYRRPVYDY